MIGSIGYCGECREESLMIAVRFYPKLNEFVYLCPLCTAKAIKEMVIESKNDDVYQHSHLICNLDTRITAFVFNDAEVKNEENQEAS